MNRSKTIIMLGVLLVLLFTSVNSFAQGRTGGYILIKPGAFIPSSDLDNRGFDTSFSGEITVGSYYSPNLALEAGVGYFRSESSKSGSDFSEEDDLWVIPVTITFKGVIPFKGGELNAGIGPGIYFANIEAEGTSTVSGDYSDDAHSTAVEGHVVVGFNFDITEKIFVGAEGKYAVTTKAHFLGTKIDLNGFMASGVLGFRF